VGGPWNAERETAAMSCFIFGTALFVKKKPMKAKLEGSKRRRVVKVGEQG
jgi:hypothetical protein